MLAGLLMAGPCTFALAADTHVLATLWGGSWKDRLSGEAKAAGTTRDAI
jgi:hypothetical protein